MTMKTYGRLLIALLALALVASGLALAAPAQAQSPSAPILLVINDSASSKFGRYLGEILRAEGLNAYEIKQLSALTAGDLTAHDLTILADTPLTAPQAALFADYVAGGGRLIAMRPDAQIAGLFGLAAPAGTLSDPYMQIDAAALLAGARPGEGLPTATLQTHGAAGRYALSGGVQLARLYSDANTATTFPAVAGATSGRTAAFTYDLASSIVYTRQGNPASANLDRDGDGVIRTVDLFMGVSGGPTWVNRDRMPIPQADVQQRLFARLVQQLVALNKPLPQLWYFPGAAKTVVIPTGDAHANPTSYYQNQINSLAPYGGKMTFYLSAAADPLPANLSAWAAQGYDFSIHPYVNASMSTGYGQAISWFQSYYQRNPGRSVRNHQVVWSGWTDAAAVAATQGFALDANFYTWGTWLQKPDNSWASGYVTGSGRPMKFISDQGTIIPVYQQLTQLVDEYLFNVDGMQNLTAPQALAISRQMIDASQAGDYAALMTQFHVDYFGTAEEWAQGTLAYAQSLGIPILTAEQWLNFTETRDNAGFGNVAWDSSAGQLSFTLTAGSSTPTLSILLPLVAGGRTLTSVQVDGVPVTFSTFTVSGRNQALVSVTAGNHTVAATYGGPTPTSTNTPTALPSATATTTPQNTPIATATSTATAVPATATPTTSPLGQTITTYGDFEACGIGTGVVVSSLNGGALRLAPALVDDFDGTALNGANWLAGTWSGGAYAPAPAAGVLTLAGGSSGWVRSQALYTHGEVEFVAEFGAGAWQHLGLGAVGFDANRYLIFSTAGGDGNLYARANNNGSEQNSNLGPIPTGEHLYHIAWSAVDAATDRVDFTLDGQLRAQFSLPSAGASNYVVYLSNNGAAPLRVARTFAGPAWATAGTWNSCTLDAGASQAWTNIAWQGVVVAGGAVNVQARWGSDGSNWSAWAAVPTTGLALNPPARMVQYSAALAGDGGGSSSLDAVQLAATVQLPTATPVIPPTATNTATPVPPTATFTATPLPPTATFTATPVPSTPTSTPVPPPPSLTMTGSPAFGSVSVSVGGKFRLDFTSAAKWAPVSWFDLSSENVDIANKGATTLNRNVLLDPVEFTLSGVTYTLAQAQNATLVIVEQSPARVILRANYDLLPPLRTFRVQADYAIYSSGRMAVSMTLRNGGSSSTTLSTVAYGYRNVEDSKLWTSTSYSSNRGQSYQRSNGVTPRSNLLAISQGAETSTGTRGTGNLYWTVTNQTLAANATFARQFELQLYPSGLTTTQMSGRVNDVRTPGITVVAGASLLNGGFDKTMSAYTLQASAGTITFYPTSAQVRSEPVFAISNWTNPAWHILQGGVIVATSDQPIGASLVASFDGANSRLVFQSLSVIPTTASTDARTFSVISGLPPTATFTATPVPPTATFTSTPIPPTATFTVTPIPPTATFTSTPIPPTATFTATPVPPTATFTVTPIPPTATFTVTPIPPTATFTATPVPPTATFTATPVPPTATFTATPVPPTATFTATPVPPTATFTATPVPPTATPTSLPTPGQPSGGFTHNTAADFGAGCAVLGGVTVSDGSGGEVRLAATLEDYFAGSAVDSARWRIGNAYPWYQANATVSGGVLSLLGGHLSSYNSFAPLTPRFFEAYAQLLVTGDTPSWPDLGFYWSDAPYYFNSQGIVPPTEAIRAFVVPDHPAMFVRSHDGTSPYEDVDLLPTPDLTQYHLFRIEWDATETRYYIDGVLRATTQGLASLDTYVFLYSQTPGTDPGNPSPIQVDWTRAGQYPASGLYTSCAYDAGQAVDWGTVNLQQSAPAGTSVAVQTRTSADGVNWSGWQATTGADIVSPAGRYFQYQLMLATNNSMLSPEVQSVAVSMLATQGATPTLTPVPPTATPTNTATPVLPTATFTATPAPPTATPTNTATPVPPTATFTATPVLPTATPASTPSVPVTPVAATTTWTTLADLSAPCVVSDNSFVTSAGGGAVTLLGPLDAFDAPALNTARWLAGSWSGGAYAPVQAGGRLTLGGGGYVRSIATQRLGDLEVTAEIGQGAWQHIGFAPDGFGANQYLIFSTFTGDGNLYARANNNASEVRTNLGPIPAGMHNFRIVWSVLNANTDQAVFSIDGQVVATLQAPAAGASNYAIYLSNNGAATLSVETLHVAPPYAPAGSYTGCILDSMTGGWESLAWSATNPASTTLAMQARTSADASTWSAWETLAASGAAPAQQGRYLQYRALLNTANTALSPRLDSVTVQPAGAGVSSLEASAMDVSLPESWGSASIFLPLVNQ